MAADKVGETSLSAHFRSALPFPCTSWSLARHSEQDKVALNWEGASIQPPPPPHLLARSTTTKPPEEARCVEPAGSRQMRKWIHKQQLGRSLCCWLRLGAFKRQTTKAARQIDLLCWWRWLSFRGEIVCRRLIENQFHICTGYAKRANSFGAKGLLLNLINSMDLHAAVRSD